MSNRLSLTFSALAVAATLATSAFAESRFGPLLTPAQLAEAQTSTKPLVLDIREGQDSAGKTVYEAGHVPGAIAAPYARWRGPADNPGQVPSDAKLTELFRSLGIEKERPVVVVHQGKDDTDFGAAARVYWTLKSAGVSQLAILNGGVNAWVKEGRALSQEPTAPTPSQVTVSLSHQWLATRDDVRAATDGKAKATLIDARPESFYKGETAHPAASRPGTLPHARLFTHSNWFSSGPAIVDQAAARQLVSKAGLGSNPNLISFCNTGHWASTNWFALSELAGVEGVKLYPESMVGWSKADLPMENVPGRLDHLWSTVKNWF